MRRWEEKRIADISEYILVTHIVCILIFLMIVFSFYNVEFGLYLPAGLILLSTVFCLGIIFYIARNLIPKLFNNRSKKDELFLLVVIFPLTFAFLWYSRDFSGAKVLIVIPVIIAATAFGKFVGAGVAVAASALLFLMDYGIFSTMSPGVFQSNVIMASVTILLAWLVGGLMEVERNTQQELLKLADYDQLTGLHNHRYIQEKLIASLHKAASENTPLSVVLLDIDQLKYYNTVYGYQYGDELLNLIGHLLLNRSNEGLYAAARYGNDEFMLVFPGKDKKAVMEFTKDIRKEIEARVIDFFKIKGIATYKPFSISEGVAGYPEDGTEALPLIRAAEDDLFRRKYSKGMPRLYQSVLSEISSLKVSDAFAYLQTFITLINAKDRYTYGHSERVMSYAMAMAEKMGIDEDTKEFLRYGAFLHDIGKLEIETMVLTKEGSLKKKEWDIMRNHTVLGSEMIQAVVSFKDIVSIIRSHHENYDGSGYPDGLKGDDIPILARIVRLADSFDAMTSERPYRKALSFDEASIEIKKNAGTLYDPNLVDLFLSTVKNVYKKTIY